MTATRIEIFEQLLENDPDNLPVLFGLAKEYEKAGRHREVIATLVAYLKRADDEGNAYGMLAQAYEKEGRRDEARKAYERGIEVARAHGHPSMAEDYQSLLEMDDEE